MLDNPKPWADIYPTFSINPFRIISDLLDSINMDKDAAWWQFCEDYYDAYALYDDESKIEKICEIVAHVNATKYSTLLTTYPFSQMRRKIRSPNLTHSVSASSSGSADVLRNQTETQTETPNGYGQTRTHSVAPFDTQTLKTEYEDSVTNNGTRTVSTSYTGQPDHTASSSSGSRTDTETGSETITETVVGSDKLTMAEAMQDMESAATLWQIIEQDIAAKIFLQIWR